MSFKKSEFLSALGVVFQIWKALVDEVLSMGGGDENFRRIQTDSELRRKLAELIVKAPTILKHFSTVSASGAAKFVAADHFNVGSNGIAWMGDDFRQFFLGKTEENVQNMELNIYELVKGSVDAPILAELGDRAETTLTHLLSLLTKQAKGESGHLLTNGYANIFYIRGTDGNVWAVGACWFGDGWDLDASSVEYPGGWGAGRRVFAR